MSDIFFFFRMLVFTSLFLFVLQIRFGEQTLEQHSMDLIQHSAQVVPLNKAAQGAAKLLQDTWQGIVARLKNGVGQVFNSENQPGERKLLKSWERSKDFLREKAKATKDYIDDQFEKVEKSEFQAGKVTDEATEKAGDSTPDTQTRIEKLKAELREDGVLPAE